jgi:2-polyprenyl-3-methyl-5-hydroxy-6-metoxy-1,4-benzoquinol methylase
LLLVEPDGVDPTGSEELTFLRELVVAEAEAVFERVDRVAPARLAEDVGDAEWVLLQGAEPIFLGRASLRRMRAAAAGAAGPFRLDRIELGSSPEIHTLREYEVVEQDFLARPRTGSSAEPAAVPALLVRAEHLRTPGGRDVLTDWRAGRAELAAVATAVGAEMVGLCHCFVDYYGSARDDALPFVPEGTSDVLEVGCGKGFTGELLQRERGCRVTGVELNEQIAREARTRLHAVIHGDILTAPIEGRFDVAILFDVVEHVVRAETLLRRVASLVRPGGLLILSLPNVGHYSIVRDLLMGRWDYLPMGLLCYTHVRFFTRQTLEDWLGRCGFDSFDIHPRLTPLPREMKGLSRKLPIDAESLRTHGFHVVVRVGGQ